MSSARVKIVNIKPKFTPEEEADLRALEPFAHAFNEEGLIGYAGDPVLNYKKNPTEDGFHLIETAVKRGLIRLQIWMNLGTRDGSTHDDERDRDQDRRAYELTEHGGKIWKILRKA